MCCGKGGDLLKWRKSGIKRLVCADIADVSLDQCRSRFEEMVERTKHERRPEPLFDAEFIHADCSRVRLKNRYRNPNQLFELSSIQFSLHYAFESYEQAVQMLQNACECLKPGGYFIGTIPDANQLVLKLRQSSNLEFGNAVYKVKFDESTSKEDLGLFGAKYFFTLEEQVVNCAEYLISFQLLTSLLESMGMELVLKKSFEQLADERGNEYNGKQLMARMQALEPFPPDDDVDLMGKDEENQYDVAKAFYESRKHQSSDGRPIKLGTLSAAEWEVAELYIAFAFRKRKTTENENENGAYEKK